MVARTAGCASSRKSLFSHWDGPYHVHPSIYIMMWSGYCSLGTQASHLLHAFFNTIGMQEGQLAKHVLLNFSGFPAQFQRDLSSISKFLHKSLKLSD